VTYFGFLIRFLIMPILGLLAIAWWDARTGRPIPGFWAGHTTWIGILVHVVLAVLYTTPWDNYLVATGVWFYNPELVTGILIGYVPIEEYTFFVLEAILAGLWWLFLARRISPPARAFRPAQKPGHLSAGVLALLWAAFTFVFFSGYKPLTYLSITLVWALPPILLQILFGADILWHHRRLVGAVIVVPGLYLSLMDIFALADTTWSISAEQTTGLLLFGILPLEEVVFFFITNVLIAFGMTLLLSRESHVRLFELKKSFERYLGRPSDV